MIGCLILHVGNAKMEWPQPQLSKISNAKISGGTEVFLIVNKDGATPRRKAADRRPAVCCCELVMLYGTH